MSQCSSLYGCHLWNLDDNKISELKTAWNVSCRKVLNLDSRTRTYLLSPLMNSMPIEDIIMHRMLCFFLNGFKHKSNMISFLFTNVLTSKSSDMLRNINTILQKANIKYEELVSAVKHLGEGCGLDGLRSDIIRMVPPSFLKSIHNTFDRIFHGDYPKQWEVQILNAVAKDGHSSKDPKLRGIGLAQILARLYDIILGKRFKDWYVPNGFRPSRDLHFLSFQYSCYSCYLLHYANKEGKELCIGFMDYEKAFDFANAGKVKCFLVVHKTERR